MDDLVWRDGVMSIARYYPPESEDIVEDIFAPLAQGEVCGYREGGSYRRNYTEQTPNLKPKPTLFRRIFGAKSPEREHLFVSTGPHKLLMPFTSKWEDNEDRPLLALMTVTISPTNISKLFSTAMQAEGQTITPLVLVSAVHAEISTRFNEYVGKLNRPDSWETADDIKRIENEFRMIADSELSHLGVDVDSVALNLGSTATQDLVSLEKDLGRARKLGVIEGIAGHDESQGEMGESQLRLLRSLASRSEAVAATSPGADDVIESTAEARLESLERILLAQIKEEEERSVHAQKLREIEAAGMEQRKELERIKANQSMLEEMTDNADDETE